MAKYSLNRFDSHPIDIRKIPGKDDREKVTNYALVMMRQAIHDKSGSYERVRELVVEFNKRMNKKSPVHIANIIRLWNSGSSFK